jgi:hypothetical protein
MGSVGQPLQTAGLVAANPGVDTLTTDAVAFGDLDDGHGVQHLQDGVIALLGHADAPEHSNPASRPRQQGPQPSRPGQPASTINRHSRQRSPGTVESISRTPFVKHQPQQHTSRHVDLLGLPSPRSSRAAPAASGLRWRGQPRASTHPGARQPLGTLLPAGAEILYLRHTYLRHTELSHVRDVMAASRRNRGRRVTDLRVSKGSPSVLRLRLAAEVL